MSGPLCAIGAAVLEVIGLNPQSYGYRSEAHWPHRDVFDGSPFYQPTGMGERIHQLRLAARPHVMGGLDALAILRRQHEALVAVPYIRLSGGLSGGLVGEVGEDVAITRLGIQEERIAPDGIGRRWEVDVELTVVGRQAGGFGSGGSGSGLGLLAGLFG